MLQPLFHFRKFQIRQNAHQLGIIESSVVKPIVLCVPLPLSEPEIQTFIRPFYTHFYVSLTKKNHLIYIENLIPLQRLIRCYGKVLAERFVIPDQFTYGKSYIFRKSKCGVLLCYILLNKTSPPLRQRHNHNSFS